MTLSTLCNAPSKTPTRNNMLDKIAELEDKVEMLKRQVKNAQDRVKTKNDCYYKYHKHIEELLENPDKTEACDKIYNLCVTTRC